MRSATPGEDEDLPKAELVAVRPAARCRDCSAETWRVSLQKGWIRVKHPKHRRGCREPIGRIDLLRSLPLRRRETFLNGDLLLPMSDAEVRQAEAQLRAMGLIE